MKKDRAALRLTAFAMAAVTIFASGGNLIFANESTETAIQEESDEMILPVLVDDEAWVYTDMEDVAFGTWKSLNIKVNETMYPLSKNEAVNVPFHNGDTIKIYAGDSYELWGGNIEINGEYVNIKIFDKYAYTGATIWGCDLVYSDGKIIFEKTEDPYSKVNYYHAFYNIFYDYDLSAKTESGKPIEGIKIKDNSDGGVYFWDETIWTDMLSDGYIGQNVTWGNGNSFSLKEKSTNGENKEYEINTICVTDETGYTNMYLPTEYTNNNLEDYAGSLYIGGAISYAVTAGQRMAYVGNGLVDITINDDHYTTTSALGIETSLGTRDGGIILGDYYDASEASDFKSDSVVVQDYDGKDIATVTMSMNETEKVHLIGKTSSGRVDCTGMEPVVDVKMADGASDWDVTVDFSDSCFHINVVGKDSASNIDDGTTNDESTNQKYIADLSKAESQTISVDTFTTILAQNATKDVVIKSNNGVAFTFAKGTMASVDGKTEYDFSTSINSAYADTMPSYITKDNFVSQINFNYSGKLPATANIRFYAGTEYAGQTLYYSLMNADNTFAEVQAVVVDADGYMTVKQDHCSSYVVTKTEPKLPSNDDTKTDDGNNSNNGDSSDNGNTSNNGNASTSDNNTSSGNTTVSTDKNASSANTTATSPKTGDMTPIAIYIVMAVAAMGVIVFVKRRKTA